MNRFQKCLCNIAGADTELLSECPTDQKKYAKIGGTILVTTIIAFFAGTAMAWYFTQNSESQVSGAFLWSIAFGALWSTLIFTIDSNLVITLKKNPENTNKFYWVLPFFLRAFLAVLIAFMVSIPVELFIFEDFIKANQESFVLNKSTEHGKDLMDNSDEDLINKRLTEATLSVSRLDSLSSSLSSDIESIESKIRDLEVAKLSPNSKAYNDAVHRVKKAQDIINSATVALNNEVSESRRVRYRQQISNARSEKKSASADQSRAAEEWRADKQKKINDLNDQLRTKRAEKKSTDESLNSENESKRKVNEMSLDIMQKRQDSQSKMEEGYKKGNRFILYFEILEYAVRHRNSKGEYTNKIEFIALWFIRVIFILFEILPTVVKIAMPIGPYDRILHAREKNLERYLLSREYEESMIKIYGSQTNLQLKEVKMREEAELKMKEEIIERIVNAQTEMAKLAIEKWEKEERKKYTDNNPVDDMDIFAG